MAETRSFTLIGKFDDKITPSLKGINTSIDKLKNNFKTLGSVSKSVSKNLKTFADANKDLQNSFKGQTADIRSMAASLKMLRTEIGRVNRAYNAASKKGMRLPPVPSTPTPGAPGRTPRGGGYAAAVGGGVAGAQLGSMMTDAIVRGFQLGTSIMMMPLRNFMGAMAERIQDEMSDITSAGAMFSIDRKDNLKLFNSFNESRRAQEALNARLAKSAAELPGETAEYVQQAKRITDTMMTAMGKNQQAFQKFGEELGAKQGDKMDALGVVIQKFTEKAVLLGKGGPGGSAGAMYGVPQLLEMMMSKDVVNIQGMTARYASLRGNPLLANALQAAETEINATAVGSAERLRVIMKTLDNALPQEVIGAMRNSMDGIVQSIKSAFLDPEVGLFGYGRKLQGILVARRDELGRYLDKAGNIVSDIAEAEMETTSLFGLLRDSLAGFVLPLGGLLDILPQLFDPLAGIGMSLTEFREMSQDVLKSFNEYTAWFKEQEGVLKETASARGGLAAFANLLRSFGVFSTSEFEKIGATLKNPEANLADIAKNIFTTLFNSDFMKQVGEVIGSMVGGAISMVGNLMSGATDMANSGPFAEGLAAGWKKTGGEEGVKKVFSSLFTVIGNLLVNAFKAAPLEMSILTALTVGMPLLTGAITAGITSIFGMAASSLGSAIPTLLGGLGIGTGGAAGGAATAAAGGGLAAVAAPVAAVAAAAAVAKMTEKPAIAISQNLQQQGAAATAKSDVMAAKGDVVGGLFEFIKGELFNVAADFIFGFNQVFAGLADFVVGLFSSPEQVAEGVKKIFHGLWALFTGIGHLILGLLTSIPGLLVIVANALKNLFVGLAMAIGDVWNKAWANRPKWMGGAGGEQKKEPEAKPQYDGDSKRGAMPLNKAVATEMAKKPKGSDLVIANSSETVIPAAGGYGMKDFLDTLKIGFDQVLSDVNRLGYDIKITSEDSRKRDEEQGRKTDALDNKVTQQYEKTQQDILNINKNMSAFSKELGKISSMGMGGLGGLGGGMALGSGYGSGGGAIAGALGDFIKQTGGAPGSIHEHPAHGGVRGRHAPGSYHYSGRAIDIGAYANEQAGVISRIQQFNQKMGVKPVEFLHAGNDANHQDHVHVAYALGKGNPAFFRSQEAAERWEASMAGKMNVRSVTGNTKEGFGGGEVSVTNNITVNAQPNQNVDELASIIALKIGEAVEDARAASIFV